MSRSCKHYNRPGDAWPVDDDGQLAISFCWTVVIAGLVIGAALIGILALFFGWRLAFLIYGGFCAVGFGLLLIDVLFSFLARVRPDWKP